MGEAIFANLLGLLISVLIDNYANRGNAASKIQTPLISVIAPRGASAVEIVVISDVAFSAYVLA